MAFLYRHKIDISKNICYFCFNRRKTKTNQVMKLLLNRKSVRAYENRKIDGTVKEKILKAALRAPTAGNMMRYSIIEVTDQKVKRKLVKTCGNQPFIAKAPLVLLFLADCQRWDDYFKISGVKQFCERERIIMRKPEEGDLFIACCDAIIAAQTAVIAAESFGIGSCYIGNIMERYEIHKKLFNLPQYVFPICLLCFGYPTEQQKKRELTQRFDKEFIVFKDRYERFNEKDFEKMFKNRQKQMFGDEDNIQGCNNVGQLMYLRKFVAPFAEERNKSVRKILKVWKDKK